MLFLKWKSFWNTYNASVHQQPITTSSHIQLSTMNFERKGKKCIFWNEATFSTRRKSRSNGAFIDSSGKVPCLGTFWARKNHSHTTPIEDGNFPATGGSKELNANPFTAQKMKRVKQRRSWSTTMEIYGWPSSYRKLEPSEDKEHTSTKIVLCVLWTNFNEECNAAKVSRIEELARKSWNYVWDISEKDIIRVYII